MMARLARMRRSMLNAPASATFGVEGSYLRLIDSCITQLKAQGPFRTCDESKAEEEEQDEEEHVESPRQRDLGGVGFRGCRK